MSKSGFSWKRATGVSKMKANIARKTGIPTTKAGRKRKARDKVAKVASCGCLTLTVPALFALIVALIIIIFAV